MSVMCEGIGGDDLLHSLGSMRMSWRRCLFRIVHARGAIPGMTDLFSRTNCANRARWRPWGSAMWS